MKSAGIWSPARMRISTRMHSITTLFSRRIKSTSTVARAHSSSHIPRINSAEPVCPSPSLNNPPKHPPTLRPRKSWTSAKLRRSRGIG
jgi:hypothetical protein